MKAIEYGKARRRIDVHQHLLPPRYAAWLRAQGAHEAGGRALPAWSAEEALAVMEAHEIERAILSVSTPGVRVTAQRDDGEARKLNEFAARVASGLSFTKET